MNKEEIYLMENVTMPIPCEQAMNIVKIETTLNHVVTLLEKHEAREERMIDAMEVVAAQAEAIKFISSASDKQDNAIEDLYKILHNHIENRQTPTMTCSLLSGEYGKYFLGSIIIGATLDVYNNFSLFKSIYQIFK